MRDRRHDMAQTMRHLAVLVSADFVPPKWHDLARHIGGGVTLREQNSCQCEACFTVLAMTATPVTLVNAIQCNFSSVHVGSFTGKLCEFHEKPRENRTSKRPYKCPRVSPSVARNVRFWKLLDDMKRAECTRRTHERLKTKCHAQVQVNCTEC